MSICNKCANTRLMRITLATFLCAQTILYLYFVVDELHVIRGSYIFSRYIFSFNNQSLNIISSDVHTDISLRHTDGNWTMFKGQNISTEFEKFYNVGPDYLQNPLVNKHKYILSLNNENLCTGKQIFIISFIHTAPPNFEERQIIRSSWGSFRKYKNRHFQHIFLIGLTNDTVIQEKLQKESNIYRDIAQGNFIDSYRNLTYKQIFGLYWVTKFCNHAEFVIKIDDDVIVNTPLITEFLLNKANTTKMMQCQFYVTDHPERSITSKWYTTPNEYSPSKFPPYCIGLAYLMSADVIYKFYQASKKVPFFWVDDVYVGGILPWSTGIEMNCPNNFHSSAKKQTDLPFRPTSMFYIYYNRTLLKKTWRYTWKILLTHTKKYLMNNLTVALSLERFIGVI